MREVRGERDGDEAGRERAIRRALAAGRRAIGPTFDEAIYRTLLEGAPPDVAELLASDWEAIALDREQAPLLERAGAAGNGHAPGLALR